MCVSLARRPGRAGPGSRLPACVAVCHCVSWLVRVCVCPRGGDTACDKLQTSQHILLILQARRLSAGEGEGRLGGTGPGLQASRPSDCVPVCVCRRCEPAHRVPQCRAGVVGVRLPSRIKHPLPGHYRTTTHPHPCRTSTLVSFRKQGETPSHQGPGEQ